MVGQRAAGGGGGGGAAEVSNDSVLLRRHINWAWRQITNFSGGKRMRQQGQIKIDNLFFSLHRDQVIMTNIYMELQQGQHRVKGFEISLVQENRFPSARLRVSPTNPEAL